MIKKIPSPAKDLMEQVKELVMLNSNSVLKCEECGTIFEIKLENCPKCHKN